MNLKNAKALLGDRFSVEEIDAAPSLTCPVSDSLSLEIVIKKKACAYVWRDKVEIIDRLEDIKDYNELRTSVASLLDKHSP